MKPLKRFFDLCFSGLGLLILSPVFLGIALSIKLSDKSSVFFIQERIGYRGAPFKIYKFRTMVAGAGKMGRQLTPEGDPRITPVGRILRKTKLDELPQLVNVLKGEMSLVGPRPEVPGYVARYHPELQRVMDLVPGITDPASIKYFNEGEILARSSDPEKTYIEEIMPEKIKINLAYAQNANLRTDIMVIINTIFRLFQVKPGTGFAQKSIK